MPTISSTHLQDAGVVLILGGLVGLDLAAAGTVRDGIVAGALFLGVLCVITALSRAFGGKGVWGTFRSEFDRSPDTTAAMILFVLAAVAFWWVAWVAVTLLVAAIAIGTFSSEDTRRDGPYDLLVDTPADLVELGA